MTERNHNPCVWKLDSDMPLRRKMYWRHFMVGVTWLTSCEESHTFISEGPKAWAFDFCPYCGGPIEEYEGEH